MRGTHGELDEEKNSDSDPDQGLLWGIRGDQKQWALVKGKSLSYFNNPAYRDSRPVEGVSTFIRGTGRLGITVPFYRTPQPDSFLGDPNDRTGLVFNPPTKRIGVRLPSRHRNRLNSDKTWTDKNICPRMAEVAICVKWKSRLCSQAITLGTAKVGTIFRINGPGDMHGNVIEWCLDCFDGYSWRNRNGPEGAERGTYRVCRGGAWTKDAHYCRSAQRSYFGPTNSGSNFYGFRIAMMAP